MKLFRVVTLWSVCCRSHRSPRAGRKFADQTDETTRRSPIYQRTHWSRSRTFARHRRRTRRASARAQGIFRASYVLKYGNLAIVPFDALVPVVDATVYVPVPIPPASEATLTLHTSGIGDVTYLPTIGYVIPENDTTHTVIAATAYVTAPTGSYDVSRPVNIGDNRWRIQPQVGVSQRFLKSLTFDLLGNLAFYTSNTKFGYPGGYVTMTQSSTLGLEAHLTADLSPDFYLGTSYYLAAVGQQNVEAPGLPLKENRPEQTIQTLRFTFGIRAEKATLLLLQFNQDIEASGGASIRRFIGARLSHALFF